MNAAAARRVRRRPHKHRPPAILKFLAFRGWIAHIEQQLTKRSMQAIMLDQRLEQNKWEAAVKYVWSVHNLYPLSRNASRNGRGPRPLTQMSQNHVDEAECDRRIEYSIPPGSLAFVHQPGKHGGAQDISNGRWSRCVGMDKDTPIFERVPSAHHGPSREGDETPAPARSTGCWALCVARVSLSLAPGCMLRIRTIRSAVGSADSL
eukprot:COSAG01_NODE_201_length_22135_cov_408.324288_6_plen_206_part_00